MELIADVLLIAGAIGAAVYCRTLGRRLGALASLDSGVGAAIAALSRQVDELRASVETARNASGDQARETAQLTARAEMAAGRLELLLASLHEGEGRRPLGTRAAKARAAQAAAPAARRPWETTGADDGGDDDVAPDDADAPFRAGLGRAAWLRSARGADGGEPGEGARDRP
jgi:hypothetical protein